MIIIIQKIFYRSFNLRIVKRVAVIGGAGFIGRYLVERCLQEAYNVTIVDNLTNQNSSILESDDNSPGPAHSGLSFYREDITNSNRLLDIFSRQKVDTCIHLAAKISVPDSVKNPENTIDVNVKGTLNVLEACSKNKVNNFVFASSAAVYGEPKYLPIPESHILDPLSPYGASKVAGEALVSCYRNLKKIKNASSLRFFNVYGKGQTLEYAGVITKFAERLSQRLPPVIYGDGNQTRDFVSVKDVVKAIMLTAKMREPISGTCNNYNVYNIGTGRRMKITELAKLMIKIFRLDLEPIFCEPKEGDITSSYADIRKSKKELRFIGNENINSDLKEQLFPRKR
jgi:UDP-glucose 4-epimerase